MYSCVVEELKIGCPESNIFMSESEWYNKKTKANHVAYYTEYLDPAHLALSNYRHKNFQNMFWNNSGFLFDYTLYYVGDFYFILTL